MGKHDFFRTRFIVEPKDSVMYGSKEKVKEFLLSRDSIAGIGISAKETPSGNIEIITRTALKATALLDRNYLRGFLNDYCGRIIEEYFEGRRWKGRQEIWETVEIS